MKMDQCAWLCRTGKAAQTLKESLGLEDADWTSDFVSYKSRFDIGEEWEPGAAQLHFCYQLGIELEYLTFAHGRNWHDFNPMAVFDPVRDLPILSHIGIHLEDAEEFPPDRGAITLVQETITQLHTAKYLTDPQSLGFGRRYHYKIYQMGPGCYIKYIKRVHPK